MTQVRIVIRTGRRRRRAVLYLTLVGLLLLAVLGVGFASSRPTRVVSSTLGSSQFPGFPAVAADGSLGFDAVWTDRAIRTAHWSAATRKWGKATTLSRANPGQSAAQIVASPSGAAAAVWISGPTSGTPQAIDASYRASASSAWQGPVTLVFSRTSGFYNPQLGMDSHGDAFAAWRTDSRSIVISEHLAGSTSWSPPATVVTDTHLSSLALAVSPDGTLAVVWEHYLSGGVLPPSGGTKDVLYLRVKPAGQGSWLRRFRLGTDGAESGQDDAWIFLYGPRVAVNAHSTLFVTWQWPHKGEYHARVSILTARGEWRKPQSVVLPGTAGDPVIAGDDTGHATVLWEGAKTIEEADLSPSARVLSTRSLGSGGDPRLVSDSTGDIAGVWGVTGVRPPGRTWCPRIRLRAAEDDWAVAIAPDGVAQVLWEHWPGGRPEQCHSRPNAHVVPHEISHHLRTEVTGTSRTARDGPRLPV